MKTKYSHTLLLVWQVADLEAKRLQAAFLEPPHFLLGLCKSVDIDLASVIQNDAPDRTKILEELTREIQLLRRAFQEAGFDAMRFRRRYRTVLPEGSAGLNLNQGRLHRNDASKDVFIQAERLAKPGRGVVFPIHLLHALLEEKDEMRDDTIASLGIDPERLFQRVKHQMFLHDSNLGTSGIGADEICWN